MYKWSLIFTTLPLQKVLSVLGLFKVTTLFKIKFEYVSGSN